MQRALRLEINRNVSSRITILRFPLIVGVVFIHNYNLTVNLAGGQKIGGYEGGYLSMFIRYFISQGIARTAVPLFFLISGYLLFYNFDGSFAGYKDKLSRRVRTLLVPFLIWNFATLLVYAVGEATPATRGFFSNLWPPVGSFTIRDYADALLGLFTKYPIAAQFWFIRDLIALVLLAPVIYLLCRSRAVFAVLLVVLLAFWMIGYWPLLWPGDNATLFFVSGAYLAIHKLNLCRLDRAWVPATIVWVCLLVADSISQGQARFPVLHNLMILAGVASIWSLTKFAAESRGASRALVFLSSASFFVYAAHEPCLTILRKIFWRIVSPHSDLTVLCLYFFCPVVLIAFLVLTFHFLSRKAPVFTGIITGRSPSRIATQTIELQEEMCTNSPGRS
jgi:peptidoglycan/LPS O-acetylase OafA/YrhL